MISFYYLYIYIYVNTKHHSFCFDKIYGTFNKDRRRYTSIIIKTLLHNIHVITIYINGIKNFYLN